MIDGKKRQACLILIGETMNREKSKVYYLCICPWFIISANARKLCCLPSELIIQTLPYLIISLCLTRSMDNSWSLLIFLSFINSLLWFLYFPNDIVQVERTRLRPVASGLLTPFKGLCFLGFQLLLGLGILLQLNNFRLVVFYRWHVFQFQASWDCMVLRLFVAYCMKFFFFLLCESMPYGREKFLQIL